MLRAVSLLVLAVGTEAITCNSGSTIESSGSGCGESKVDVWNDLPCATSTECLTYQHSTTLGSCTTTTVQGTCVVSGSTTCATYSNAFSSSVHTGFSCTECSSDKCNSMVYASSSPAATPAPTSASGATPAATPTPTTAAGATPAPTPTSASQTQTSNLKIWYGAACEASQIPQVANLEFDKADEDNLYGGGCQEVEFTISWEAYCEKWGCTAPGAGWSDLSALGITTTSAKFTCNEENVTFSVYQDSTCNTLLTLGGLDPNPLTRDTPMPEAEEFFLNDQCAPSSCNSQSCPTQLSSKRESGSNGILPCIATLATTPAPSPTPENEGEASASSASAVVPGAFFFTILAFAILRL